MRVRIVALLGLAVAVLALASCEGGHFGEPPPTPERGPQLHPGQ
jgi:hypothetical protein